MALVGIALVHYMAPPFAWLTPSHATALSRHAAERILLVLPVAAAAYAVGQVGGWIALGIALLIMLPRALWISPYPSDALVETAVSALAGAIVVRMIHSQRLARTEREAALSHLQAVASVTALLSRPSELEHILDQALGTILTETGLEAGIIYVHDRETHRLAAVAHRGIADVPLHGFETPAEGDALLTRLSYGDEVQVMGDQTAGEQLSSLAKPLPAGVPMVVVPLRSEGRVQGAMALGASCARPIALEELSLVSAIGNQAGIAIQNAYLHREAERRLRVQQQLNVVAEQITSELDPDRVLPKVLQIAEELTGADGSLIALFNRESELMHYPYLHNLPGELADVSVPPDTGLSAEVMTARRPIVIDDYPQYPRAIPAFVAAGVTRIAGVPVVFGDEAFGTLAVVGLGKDGRFTESDVALLQGIGRQAGIAIQNARLYARMRFYAREIVRAQEGERRRIARELHDETIQMLIVLLRRLESLQALADELPEVATRKIKELQQLTGSTLQGMRRIVQDLRPPTLDHLGLVATLDALVSDLGRGEGPVGRLVIVGNERRLAAELELTLFRITQEAVSNARRHSGASLVTITVDFRPDAVRIEIDDNGRGFNAPARMDDMVSAGRLGLIGMYERARNLGGTLEIRSAAGLGTSVVVCVPERAEQT